MKTNEEWPRPVSAQLLRTVGRIARARHAAVLITGETGTGKEVAARAIHRAGGSVGDFVPIDCGSLTGSLVESELFGHVKGAFTDAKENKAGLIGEANGGTAFFDEIGDLPLDMQVKLLRVIQEREYRPVGSAKSIPVDMRVIAATWRDLPKAIADGKFRQDLFYRLNVLNVQIPPLRKRRGEVLALVEYFLQRYAPGCKFSDAALNALFCFDWPGNVRELGNVIERVAAMADGPLFAVADLPEEVLRDPDNDPPLECRVGTLADSERDHILAALKRNDGDKGRTATELGIDRATLFRKLKGYEEEKC